MVASKCWHGREGTRAGSGPIRWAVAACLVAALAGCIRAEAAALPADGPDARLRALAEAGDAGAMTALGARSEHGAGRARDPAQALAWYRRAAGRGDALGQYLLGQMYLSGTAVPPSPERAAEQFALAAARGLPEAQAALARLYEQGSGVARDFRRAAQLYALAAMSWDAQGGGAPLDGDRLTGRADRRPTPESVKWYRRAAALGIAEAQFDLARALERGDGTARDPDQARGWYLAAATQGHGRAAEALERVDLATREPVATGPATLQAVPPPPEPDRPTPVRLVAALPPVPPIPAPPGEVAAPVRGAGFAVHLASYREPEQAVRGWAELKRLYGDLLGGLEPAIAMVELGERGIFFRLLAGGFADRADARALCAALSQRGAWCQTLDAAP